MLPYINVKVVADIEMNMPIDGSDITTTVLRRLANDARKELRELYPTATNHVVNIVLFCDHDQRIGVGSLPGFVWANQFIPDQRTRLDFGAFENFRFKWKH